MALIATDSRPALPDITSLDRVPYFTGELPTVDEAVEPTGLPRSLLIVGCGYDAPESARMSPRIGTGVTVLERDPPWLAATESGSHGGRRVSPWVVGEGPGAASGPASDWPKDAIDLTEA